MRDLPLETIDLELEELIQELATSGQYLLD
jgi:hypothetical protein